MKMGEEGMKHVVLKRERERERGGCGLWGKRSVKCVG